MAGDAQRRGEALHRLVQALERREEANAEWEQAKVEVHVAGVTPAEAMKRVMDAKIVDPDRLLDIQQELGKAP